MGQNIASPKFDPDTQKDIFVAIFAPHSRHGEHAHRLFFHRGESFQFTSLEHAPWLEPSLVGLQPMMDGHVDGCDVEWPGEQGIAASLELLLYILTDPPPGVLKNPHMHHFLTTR